MSPKLFIKNEARVPLAQKGQGGISLRLREKTNWQDAKRTVVKVSGYLCMPVCLGGRAAKRRRGFALMPMR